MTGLKYVVAHDSTFVSTFREDVPVWVVSLIDDIKNDNSEYDEMLSMYLELQTTCWVKEELPYPLLARREA